MTPVELFGAVIGRARAGVDYHPQDGAMCPGCGRRARVCTTRRWDGGIRIRYHRCTNELCIVGNSGVQIKSVEVRIK